MNHHSRLAALAIAPVLAAILVPATAFAELQTYYRAGAWHASSGKNDQGGPVCGIGTTNATDNRDLSVQFEIGGSDTVFSANKPGWSIPPDTRVTVVMQIGLNTPSIVQATGHDHAIDWTLDANTMQTFDRQFRTASSMTVTFPDGSEPPWALALTGSSAISDTFGRCIRDLTRQMQTARPPANDSPAPKGATQPFGAPQPFGSPQPGR